MPYSGRQANHSLSVLFVCHNFPSEQSGLGGTELYTVNLARTLLSRNIHAAVLHPVYDSDSEESNCPQWTAFQGIDIIRVYVSDQNDFSTSLSAGAWYEPLMAELSQHPFDIVHFQHMTGSVAPTLAKELLKLKKHKFFLTLHDGNILCEQNHFMLPNNNICDGPSSGQKCAECWLERHQINENHDALSALSSGMEKRLALMRAITVEMDGIIVPTHFLRTRMENHHFSLRNVIQRPLGLMFFPVSPRVENRKLRFAFLGNLNRTKGIDLLLGAFPKVQNGNLELHLYGKNTSVIDFVHLEEALEQLGIFYHGPYLPEKLPEILSQIDVGIVPSRSDNFPTVVREFFHANVPVIGSAAGGIPELITHGVTGRLFQSNSVDGLVEELQYITAHPEVLETYRENIKPQFNMETDALELKEIYENVLNTAKVQSIRPI